MNTLLDALGGLSASPFAWAGTAILAVMAFTSLYFLFRCPLLHKSYQVSPAEAQAAVNRRFIAGWRFFATMSVGLVLTITGLYLLQFAAEPGIAFMMIVAGIVILQTEPVRLSIRDANNRVIAATCNGGEAGELAYARLRNSHVWLVSVHFLILAAMLVCLLLL